MTMLKPARAASPALPPQPQPQPLAERSPRRGAPRDGHDVAVELRRLAPFARRAILGEPGRTPDSQTLAAAYSAVVDLEDAVERLGLNGLLDYVGSLRRRVELALPSPIADPRDAAAPRCSTRFQNSACS